MAFPSTVAIPDRVSERTEIDLKLLLHRYRESKGSDLSLEETQQAVRWFQRHSQRVSLLDFALKGLVNVEFENGDLKARPKPAARQPLSEGTNTNHISNV